MFTYLSRWYVDLRNWTIFGPADISGDYFLPIKSIRFLLCSINARDVEWRDEDIVVYSYVVVRPPYTADSVVLRHDGEHDLPHHTRSINYVKHLVSERLF
jgi:hypothetical protein